MVSRCWALAEALQQRSHGRVFIEPEAGPAQLSHEARSAQSLAQAQPLRPKQRCRQVEWSRQRRCVQAKPAEDVGDGWRSRPVSRHP